jgi:hypothetical protein
MVQPAVERPTSHPAVTAAPTALRSPFTSAQGKAAYLAAYQASLRL